jgi:ribonucleotide reductase alpha subunit
LIGSVLFIRFYTIIYGNVNRGVRVEGIFMAGISDREQLELIRRSITDPEAEIQAKILLLRDIYREVVKNYRGVASNGGRLAPLPECVREFLDGRRKLPCEEDMGFTYNAIRVLMSRYMARNEYGKIVETPSMVLKRVARGFKDYVDTVKLEEILLSRRFMFNSPTLFNMFIDGAYGTLSACYVTPIYDDMYSIMDSTVVQALTFKYGGGQGFSFSNLRPRWSVVKGTGSYSSGPISFARIYDAVTEGIKQGGKRRGANMGIMHIWHPDVYNPDFDPISAYRYMLPLPEKILLSRIKDILVEAGKSGIHVDENILKVVSETKEIPPEEAGYIQVKEGPLGEVLLTNFNISVAVLNAFMKAVLKNEEWIMITPIVTGITTGDGDYKIHYTFSGEGRLSELYEKIEWMRRNPFINMYEKILREAIPRAEELTKKTGYDISRKNPYIWKYPARKLFEKIVENAWKSGDPGLFFPDNHNQYNPTPWLGIVVATNPCVSRDTRILTPKGWIKAKELFERAKSESGVVKAVLADGGALGKGGEPIAYETNIITISDTGLLIPVKAYVWHVGKKNGLRIVLEDNTELVVTPEHKLFTTRGWIEASKLVPYRDKVKTINGWTRVRKVVNIGINDFYDFTVPIYHTYIANGVVNHNCGEQPLYPFESCNLGSVSVEKYVVNGRFDLDRFYKDVQLIIDAMDAVIDLNKHPDERQDRANKFTRKIGLGIMGLADALVKLGYSYDSDEAVAFTMILMAALEAYSWKRSWELGKTRGPAPAFKCRIWDWRRMKCLEEGESSELVELHTPALLKQRYVRRDSDGWVIVHYHRVEIPDDILNRLVGETRNRVGRDGSIKLLPMETLEKIASRVFGITYDMVEEALKMSIEQVVNSPKHLLALAVFKPDKAWRILKDYGRRIGAEAPRNTVTTTIAPTGTISIIAGASSGIEPYFALVYLRRVAIGEFLEVVREFRDRLLELARKTGLTHEYIEKIFEIISKKKGSIRWSLDDIKEIVKEGLSSDKYEELVSGLEELARIFPMSMDFDPWYHLAHQIAAQLYVDQSISKTINLRKDATINDVYTVYFTAWLGGLKGVTVYRDESKMQQVIYFGEIKT